MPKPIRLAKLASKATIAAKQRRGFACMSPDKVRSICAMGGKALFDKRGTKYMARIGGRGGSR